MHFPVLHSMLGNYNDISLTRGSQQWFVKSQTKILPGYPHALFVKHTKRLLTFQAKPFYSPGYKSVQIQTVITQCLHIVRVTLFSHYPITCHIYQVLLNVRIKVKKKVTLRIASLGHLLMSLLIFKFVRKSKENYFFRLQVHVLVAAMKGWNWDLSLQQKSDRQSSKTLAWHAVLELLTISSLLNLWLVGRNPTCKQHCFLMMLRASCQDFKQEIFQV